MLDQVKLTRPSGLSATKDGEQQGEGISTTRSATRSAPQLSTTKLRPMTVGTIIQQPLAGGSTLRDRIRNAFSDAAKNEAHLTRLTSASLSNKIATAHPGATQAASSFKSKAGLAIALPLAGAMALHIVASASGWLKDEMAANRASAEFSASHASFSELTPAFKDLLDADLLEHGAPVRWNVTQESTGLSGGSYAATDWNSGLMVTLAQPGAATVGLEGQCLADTVAVDGGARVVCLNRLTNAPYRESLIYQMSALHNYERAVSEKAMASGVLPSLANGGLSDAYGIASTDDSVSDRAMKAAGEINAATHADVVTSLVMYAGGHDHIVDDLVAARLMQLAKGQVLNFTAAGVEAVRDMHQSGELAALTESAFGKSLADMSMSEIRAMANDLRPVTGLSPGLADTLLQRYQHRGTCDWSGTAMEMRGDVPPQLAGKIDQAHAHQSASNRDSFDALGVRAPKDPCDNFDVRMVEM